MRITAKEIAESLGRGKQIKNSDNSWNTCCPAHNDSDPSMTVSDGRSGKILVKCHAGCSQPEVIEALKQQGLWPKTSKVWNAMNKVPEGVNPPSRPKHPKFGVPVATWTYRNRLGRLVGLICRFENHVDGKLQKEILPLTYCQNEDGDLAWRWKSFNKPRVLYGEELLDKNKTAPILIVEGEKTADAAREILKDDYVVISWPGGSKAAKFANWEILKTRNIVMWPDADLPGYQCCASIAEILSNIGCKSVKIVRLPENLPKGWDLADEIPVDVNLDIRATIISAAEFKPSGETEIDSLNKEFAMILLGDKAVVLHEDFDPKGRAITRYLSTTAFNFYYGNKQIQVGRKWMPVTNYWLQHPHRRSFRGVVFEPGRKTHGFYNLWQGFSFEPNPEGTWDILHDHILVNICQGDKDLCKWVLAWFADMFQNPTEKQGTSLTVRGRQGTGKTILGHIMGQLVRNHYTLIDKPRMLTGQFNSHMSSTLLLHADEAFWAGNPQEKGVLKSLVTSETTRIEPKGKDSFEVNNYVRLYSSSNDEWVVPAAFEERRFAVLECGERNMQDKPYFIRMLKQMKNGGYEALLHYLLNLDLTKIDVGTIPLTAALTNQKHFSLDPISKFWFERLRDGEILPGRQMMWPEVVPCEEFYQAFVKRAQQWGIPRRASDNVFSRELRALWPKGGLQRVRRTVKVFDDYAGQYESKRVWCYTVPDLKKCRTAFDKAIGSDHEWLKTDPSEDEPAIDDKDTSDEIPF